MTPQDFAIQLRSLKLSMHGRSDLTKRQYTTVAQSFYDWCSSEGHAALFPEKLTRHHINDWLSGIADKTNPKTGRRYSAHTVRWYYRGVYAFFSFIEEDMPEAWVNPMHKVKPPKVSQTTKDLVNPDDLDRVLVALDRDKRWRDSAIISVLRDNGMRVGELVKLRPQDINWDGGYFTLGDTKNDEVRFAPFLHDTAVRLDKARKQDPKASHIFMGLRGPLTRSGVLQLLKKTFKSHGIEGIGPHDLRHSFAVNFMQRESEGATWQNMKHIGGWKSDQMAQHYAKQGEKMRAITAFQQMNKETR